MIRWGSVIKGSAAIVTGGAGIAAGAFVSSTGAGAVVGVPTAIAGATSLGWGVSEFIAGMMDASVEIPPPSLTALGTLAATGDVGLANKLDTGVDMVTNCANANPASKVEAINFGVQMVNGIIQSGVDNRGK